MLNAPTRICLCHCPFAHSDGNPDNAVEHRPELAIVITRFHGALFEKRTSIVLSSP